ncbi:ABC-type nitrate/sulfonate/bicarbonate transport system substrate-binding protein [Leucobacter exalbidus]|uniref:ABC-type nitrate/sulfonate/bicarbonate transport system substrate-binding protein n=1 Tax=Leucobacter exalbidus TaxID=662960 RepID=A0A940T401_9MICO|nr:ABC transporter substrate-binding protein [Leucobacter exalbidus]MBP1326343.1 ABC-type nitrate/sulfonate/bicarbonate transport system substrate-binding protein [Leucobacter exalbidus]
MNKKKLLGTVGVAAITAIAFTACSSGGGTDASGGSGDELTPITVLYAPVHYETAMIAQTEGYFEDAGLDVTLKAGADPAAIVSQVLSGEVEIGATSWGGLSASVAEGMPVVGIAGNGVVSTEIDTSGVLVAADSPIETVADLRGKTVGVVGIGNGTEIPLLLQAIDEGIADPVNEITQVAIPYSGMQAAIESGTVDSVFPADPFYFQMLDAGAKQVAAPVREYQGNSPITVWASATKWVEENPDTAEAFQSAMQQAFDYYEKEENKDAVLQFRADELQVPIDKVSQVLSPMSLAINVPELQAQLDAMHDFGYMRELKAQDMFWSGTPLNE